MKNDSMATLERRLSKWQKIVNGLKIALGFYAFLVLTFLAVQGIVAQQQIATVLDEVEKTTTAVRESQLANQKTGTENHEKTRAYIKCLVTEVLTVPLKDRTTVDLDTCTNSVDHQPDTDTAPNTGTNPSPTTQSTLPIPTPSAVTPKPSEPVAAAPPDPDEPVEDDRSALGRLPLVGGLLDRLGL